MKQPYLIKAKFIKRYKRFLVDVMLENNDIVTVHCPNSGSMMGLLESGHDVYISLSTNPKNKLKYKLEFIHDGSCLVGVNTQTTNNLVYEALVNKKIKELKHFDYIKKEVKYGNSRFDFFLKNDKEECFVEVKNVTLKRNPLIAEFPDAKTIRGSKHLKELTTISKSYDNIQTFNLYIVQRTDIKSFKIAEDLDKEYYDNFIHAKTNGVKFLCYDCEINLDNIVINKPLEIIYE